MTSEYPSIAKCFLDAVDTYANPRAQMYRKQSGGLLLVMQRYSTSRLIRDWRSPAVHQRRVAGLARALAELGIRPGDRVGLFAPNCPEWAIADFAIEGLGAVSVPVYFHESLDRLTYILKDSGARVVFTSGEEEARKIAECRGQLPALEHVISAAPPADLHGDILRYEALIATAGDADVAQYRSRAAEVTAKQLATIIYTSGTTGEPKGVMLSHANLTSNALDSVKDIETLPGDVGLSFLPLAHVYERVVDYTYFFRGVTVAYIEQTEMVSQALLGVHPTTTRPSSKRGAAKPD